MSELVMNSPTMACCGSAPGACRCGPLPTVNDGDLLPIPTPDYAAAASKRLLANMSGEGVAPSTPPANPAMIHRNVSCPECGGSGAMKGGGGACNQCGGRGSFVQSTDPTFTGGAAHNAAEDIIPPAVINYDELASPRLVRRLRDRDA